MEDAQERVDGFARDLESNVPITLEDDGTYRFFGNGKVVFRWKGLGVFPHTLFLTG